MEAGQYVNTRKQDQLAKKVAGDHFVIIMCSKLNAKSVAVGQYVIMIRLSRRVETAMAVFTVSTAIGQQHILHRLRWRGDLRTYENKNPMSHTRWHWLLHAWQTQNNM